MTTTAQRELRQFVARALLERPADPELLAPYLEFFRARYGGKLTAVIFYGSCLSEATRSATSTPDFFVITTDGAIPAHSPLTRLLHPLLPPASQSARLPGDGRWFKYVYLDLAQLEHLCGEDAEDLFAAGRLSKRVALVLSQGGEIEERVCRALAAAVASLVPIVCATLPPSFPPAAYAAAAVGISYQSEYRIEVPGKVEALLQAFPDYYRELHRLALEASAERGLVRRVGERYESLLGPEQRVAARARLGRSRRRGVARWPKVLLTMDGWAEAVLGKLERRTPGLVIPESHRRHPFVFALPYLLKLLREGQLRTQRD